MEETFVLIGDSDGLILNSDGVSLHRFDGPLEAPSPHLRCLSVHWVVDGGPSSRAFSDGFLLISILLNSATSLEKIHRFRSVLIFSY